MAHASRWLAVALRFGRGLGIKVVFKVGVTAPPVCFVAQVWRHRSAFGCGVFQAGADHRNRDIPVGNPLGSARSE